MRAFRRHHGDELWYDWEQDELIGGEKEVLGDVERKRKAGEGEDWEEGVRKKVKVKEA